MGRRAAAVKDATEEARLKILGEVKHRVLKTFKPNNWNPNKLTDFQKQSLKHGLEEDGWIISQALLVWGKDEKGVVRNVIIDGEHRWVAAIELGFEKGPAVVLDGLTEKQAKALTIKLDAKRGKFNDVLLGDLVKELAEVLDTDSLGLSLGIDSEQLMAYLDVDPIELAGVDEEEGSSGSIPPQVVSTNAHVKMVQLFFSEKQHAEFVELVQTYSKGVGAKNVTDAVMEAMRFASAATRKG